MLNRISTTGNEPVTAAEVKVAARVDNDLGATSSLDGLIGTLIATAREQAEQLTGRTYRQSVYLVELEDWPAVTDVLQVYRPSACVVRYWTGTAFAALPEAAYAFAAGGPGGVGTLLAPALGSAWPSLGLRALGRRVEIELTAEPPASMPACVKTFITASVAAWLKTPEALAAAALGPHPLFVSLLHGENLLA